MGPRKRREILSVNTLRRNVRSGRCDGYRPSRSNSIGYSFWCSSCSRWTCKIFDVDQEKIDASIVLDSYPNEQWLSRPCSSWWWAMASASVRHHYHTICTQSKTSSVVVLLLAWRYVFSSFRPLCSVNGNRRSSVAILSPVSVFQMPMMTRSVEILCQSLFLSLILSQCVVSAGLSGTFRCIWILLLSWTILVISNCIEHASVTRARTSVSSLSLSFSYSLTRHIYTYTYLHIFTYFKLSRFPSNVRVHNISKI